MIVVKGLVVVEGIVCSKILMLNDEDEANDSQKLSLKVDSDSAAIISLLLKM